MQQIKTVFFGTHDLATTVLQTLIEAPNISVDLVITQPDRPVGRKKILTPPPVKVLAENHGIPVEQPESLQNFQFPISNLHVGTLTEYGMMVPQSVIGQFPKGIVNVHYSLLPAYRGASPIQSAILHGESTTGVSLMMLEKSMDTGPVLAQAPYTINPDAMLEQVNDDLAHLGATLLVEKLPAYMSGEILPVPQDDSKATLCSQLSRDDGRVNWNKTAQEIYNQYRAFTPWPGVWTVWKDKRLKLLNISVSDIQIHAGSVEVEGGIVYVGTADGSIKVHELQLEGKSVMDSRTFVNGFGEIVSYTF